MKTTIEIPNSLFRQAKAAAATQGRTLNEFFTEAIQHHLHRSAEPPSKPWTHAFGGLRDLHHENVRLQNLITAEFETIDEPSSPTPAACTPKRQ